MVTEVQIRIGNQMDETNRLGVGFRYGSGFAPCKFRSTRTKEWVIFKYRDRQLIR